MAFFENYDLTLFRAAGQTALSPMDHSSIRNHNINTRYEYHTILLVFYSSTTALVSQAEVHAMPLRGKEGISHTIEQRSHSISPRPGTRQHIIA